MLRCAAEATLSFQADPGPAWSQEVVCPQTPHEWDVSHVEPTPAPLGTGWHSRVSTLRACLGAKGGLGTSLFLKLWCSVPPTLFILPLTEAFRGVLEF